MITCPNCQNQLADDAKFCNFCGSPVPQMKTCPHCGAQAKSGDVFCYNCGKRMDEAAVIVAPAPAPVVEPTPEPIVEPMAAPIVEAVAETVPLTEAEASVAPVAPVFEPAVTPVAPTTQSNGSNAFIDFFKKLPKKVYIFSGIGVAAVALIIVAAILLTSIFGASAPVYALYIKDKEVYYTDLSDDYEPWQITTDLYDYSGESENKLFASLGYSYGQYTYMTQDGSMLFYPDKLTEDSDGFNLYYRYVEDPESDHFKIDSSIRSYHVNDDASLVTYLKDSGDSYDLYQYSVDEDSKDKIASSVDDMYVSEDGSKIIYITSENGVYIKTEDDKEKLASDISELVSVNGDLDKIYYIKDSALYEQEVGEDRVKIADEVIGAVVYESGKMFYLKEGSVELTLGSYIEDDMKATDDAMVEPVYPTYPDVDDYYGNNGYDWDAYDAAIDKYNQDYDAYWDAYYEYEDKLDRDELRNELNGEKLDYSSNRLYFYDGENETCITEAYGDESIWSSDYSFESPVMIYKTYDFNSVKKVKMSEIENSYTIEYDIIKAISSSGKYHIAIEGDSQAIEHNNINSFEINDDGTKIYYVVLPENTDTDTDSADSEPNYTGELFCITIEDGELVGPESYDTDVYCYGNGFAENDVFFYYKEYNKSKECGDLYCNKNLVDYDVTLYYLAYDKDADTLAYINDANTESGIGTLKIYVDGKATKIADDVFVRGFDITPDGDVIYLADFSKTYYKGTLYKWSDGEKVKIDDDVSSIVFINDNENQYR